MAKSVYYEVKVHGEYFAQVGKDKVLRGYDAIFKLPDAKEPLGIIKKKLLMPFLKKLDPRATAVYTHFVDNITPVGKPFDTEDIPYRFQSKEQLREYCHKHHLPVDVDLYGSLGTLRDHVRIAKEEPENFPKVFAKFADKIKSEKDLMELNADVFETGHANKPVPLTEGGAAVDGVESIEDFLS